MAVRLSRKTFREWASRFESLTFSEVLAETARNGYPPSNCGRCLAGVSDSLVRVDKENFVSTNRIEFDVSAIDDALSLIVGKCAIPTAALTNRDLSRLPSLTGYGWNPYLVVSYCWRFSKAVSFVHFHTYPHYNLVGALVRKELRYVEMYREKAYEMLLTDVVRDSGIECDENEIDRWLMDQGWIHRLSGAGRRIALRIRKG